MVFSNLTIGSRFCFTHHKHDVGESNVKTTVYRKVNEENYVYDTDTKNVWKYWTASYTIISKV